MPIVNGYVTLPELKLHLDVDVDIYDVKLENVVTSVSRWIDGYCQRRFYSVTEDRVFDACSTSLLTLGAFGDVASVTAIATDDDRDGTFETMWDAADYQLFPPGVSAAPEQQPYTQIRATGSRSWPQVRSSGRAGLIRVTGAWGWAAIPQTVSEACLIQSARIFKRREAPEGVLGFDQFGTIRISGRPDPDVQQQLTYYIHPAAVIYA